MKIINDYLRHSITLMALALVVGCATPVAKDDTHANIFQKPIKMVHQAAQDALIVNGFDIEKLESNYIEGFRPRKIGFIVGSGGETIGVWLNELEPNKTRVKVDTARSFVGLAGQKNWDNQVMDEISKSLNR